MTILPQTIRAQITMAFSICFFFMALIIALNYDNTRRLMQSMHLFELAEDLNSTILEMRRYEKNYFMYRQSFNYEENLTYTNQLILLLRREKDNLINAIGPQNYKSFVEYTKDYSELMERLHLEANGPGQGEDLEASIRGTGQNLNILADQLVTTERRAINKRLQRMIPMPLISLVFLVVLLSFVIFFIGEKVVRPLARITRESEAVGKGAFQRITPYGNARNEIHHLIAAINLMMEELEKRQEQLVQSRKIASIGTLTSGIAHEINNPINNISLILESLVEDGDDMEDDEKKQLFEDALVQADRAGEIVKNLLEFSRASHPRMENVDLEVLVDKTIRLINNELNLHQIQLTKDVRTQLPRLRLDKGGLQQVLLNLLINAIQAVDYGGKIQVVLRGTDPPGEACIEIIDNGPGISPEHRDQVFDPFFTTKKEGMGTGLGLSVSYNIVRKNGGRMEVDNLPAGGARFSIFLPMPDNLYDSL